MAEADSDGLEPGSPGALLLGMVWQIAEEAEIYGFASLAADLRAVLDRGLSETHTRELQ